jgi:hypothetical protein
LKNIEKETKENLHKETFCELKNQFSKNVNSPKIIRFNVITIECFLLTYTSLF